jgi:hypothetical protein
MSQRPVSPTGRAAVFTAVCVCLAFAAHRWMSGAGVPPWALLVGTALVFVTARAAAGRERSLPAILTLVGLDQIALHLLFEAAQQHAAAVSMAASMPGMQMPGMTGSGMTGSGVATPMQMTPGMLAAHALSALVCAWWLRRGEASAHALVRAIAAWIADRIHLPLLGAYTIAVGPARRLRRTGPILPRIRLIRFALARRGPPLALFT